MPIYSEERGKDACVQLNPRVTHPSFLSELVGLAINASRSISNPSFPIGFLDKLQ